jgi:hypothetical protein
VLDKGESSCELRRRHAVGNEGAAVVEGSRNIRVEAGECPEMAYFVP